MNSFRDIVFETQEVSSSLIPINSSLMNINNTKAISIKSDSVPGIQRFIPLRCRLSPSGLLKFVIGMYGEVALFYRISVKSEWILQENALIGLDLFQGNSAGERALLSIIFADNFDEFSQNNEESLVGVNSMAIL